MPLVININKEFKKVEGIIEEFIKELTSIVDIEVNSFVNAPTEGSSEIIKLIIETKNPPA
ncbi:hypothetical protein ABER98_20965 [Domibacillus aminovorans]|uniref:hypothetical protein n=1 Tax=Domibacillus aminovorans TaxID=29332 RepID=UPI003D19F52B